jgi:hypothetical protein
VFYASAEAEFITGTTLLVDGGMTAGYQQRERGQQTATPTTASREGSP